MKSSQLLPREKLSADQCLLLAVQLASESNVASLSSLASARTDVLSIETILQVLLTYLPETVEPHQYVPLVDALAHHRLSQLDQSGQIDTSSVQGLKSSKARSRVKSLHLLQLSYRSFSAEEFTEPLVQFLIHRAHRIQEQTGLLSLLPPLLTPFIDGYSTLRTWFISSVLPLLRFEYEYYRHSEKTYTLDQVDLAEDSLGPRLWLSQGLSAEENLPKDTGSAEPRLSRDLRCLMGPWMYGDSARKRRRLNRNALRRASNTEQTAATARAEEMRHGDSSSVSNAWTATFEELVQVSTTRLPLVASAMESWNGPKDVDLGGYAPASDHESGNQEGLDERYAQTAFAAIYAAESSDHETLSAAWKLVCRIASLVTEEPPPAEVESLLDDLSSLPTPAFDINEFSKQALETDALLAKNHPLTSPSETTYTLLKHIILSAVLLGKFGHPISARSTVVSKFFLDKDEQHVTFQKLLHNLSTGQKRTDSEWIYIRGKLVWLWGWGSETTNSEYGNGVFGKINAKSIEKELLEALIQSGCYSPATNIYVTSSEMHNLSSEEVEQVIASTALQHYDNASNGNRTRGVMKKAFDIVAAFSKYYPKSATFPRLQALLAATHAMSSYSLTLQHGVPFQPVNIRVSSDPLSLIEKILAQNPGSYVKAQDLISIGINLIAAGLTGHSYNDETARTPTAAELESKKQKAQRRVIGMAIEAALHEDDFETAYSYVVNWLDTSSSAPGAGNSHGAHAAEDDIAWRAALAAGKHKSAPASSTSFGAASASLSTPPTLRRLEQRMELLSQALLLAPPPALPEILSAWRRCEEEMGALLAAESAEEDAFNDEAAHEIPGAFVESAAPVQARREVGRGAAEEAPMGLFDVARGAAAAFSKSAFPLGGSSAAPSPTSAQFRPQTAGSDAGSEGAGQERVRRRDMVASAVTGGLASGLGWVLGATPVQNPPRQ